MKERGQEGEGKEKDREKEGREEERETERHKQRDSYFITTRMQAPARF